MHPELEVIICPYCDREIEDITMSVPFGHRHLHHDCADRLNDDLLQMSMSEMMSDYVESVTHDHHDIEH